jgi:acyl dehydratase
MNVDAVLGFEIPTREQSYDERDVMLYALGVGLGDDPMDRTQLRYVYERDLVVLPTLSMVLAHPGFWIGRPELGLDWAHALHVEQRMEVGDDLPASGRVRGQYRITGISDRGVDKGATLWFEKSLTDVATGRELARLSSALLCRGDGGCGDHGTVPAPLPDVPAETPDRRVEWLAARNAALIYRLSGDRNPVHVDPDVATKAGFERPILHGLCTLGIAAQVLSRSIDPNASRRIRSLACRFTRPVTPGDALSVEYWARGDAVRFQVRKASDGAVVLGRGEAVIR